MQREAETGRVVVSYGNQGVVELDCGERLNCRYRRSIGRPFCGDTVQIERVGDEGAVNAIAARRNVFMRAARNGNKQVIAANLDKVLIVVAPSPPPSQDLIDRYLVAAHSLGIEPVLILNKAELPTGTVNENSALHRLADYSALGYTVVETSCMGPPGIQALSAVIGQQTVILVGQSGVGKSSLINALLPELELQTGDLSRVTGKGTHTTTTTIMYPLPGGGHLIDSPGVWEYGLWKMTADELFTGFAELQPFAEKCRFHNCRHDDEPGCAVQQACESGLAPVWRYQGYRRLLAQTDIHSAA